MLRSVGASSPGPLMICGRSQAVKASRCRGKVGKGSRVRSLVGSAAGSAGVPRGLWWEAGRGVVPGGAVDMGGMWAGAAWVSGRGLVCCGLMGPGAVGPSLVGPGPIGAAQNPGGAVDAGPGGRVRL